MDAVAAADGGGVFMLHRAALDRGQQGVDILQQNVGGAHQLQVQRGVQHVAAGHALMHETRPVLAGMGRDLFRHPGEEGDDIMLGDGLDGVDGGHIHLGVGCPPCP